MAITASWAESWTDECSVTVLNVGQGQCILLQSEGKTYLVDCGGSYDDGAADLAAETLHSQGIYRLDGIILTHFDRDHSGGIPYLLTRVSCDSLFVPDAEDEEDVLSGIVPMLKGNLIRISQDLCVSYGQTEITIFGPVVMNSDNDSSLAVLFRKENCDILITGDRSATGEWILTQTSDLPEVDVLVAGHHGSKTSTSTEFLEVVRPKITVISVGRNAYGLPAGEVLNRLEECGSLVYRTDVHGNIRIRR